MLALMAVIALIAPMIAGDPQFMVPANRLRPPSAEHWFGTDPLGRDVFARSVYGARISLIVGLSVSAVSVSVGLAIGLAAGYFRRLDNVLMRIMDGLMAIPAILLAIALVSLNRASVGIVIIAVAIPEIPALCGSYAQSYSPRASSPTSRLRSAAAAEAARSSYATSCPARSRR